MGFVRRRYNVEVTVRTQAKDKRIAIALLRRAVAGTLVAPHRAAPRLHLKKLRNEQALH